jgi:LPXTG-motif cell wall-anchored protein
MKFIGIACAGLILFFSGNIPAYAHSDGAMSIHEVSKEKAPTALLEISKDPTGGFNVHVKTTNFTWRPEMASMKHVQGEGHAHVFLDGRKIMRIYNEWFHLNTFQFATRSGEQLLSVEFVGNDHAAYTIQGSPVGDTQIIDVFSDEIQPTKSQTPVALAGFALLLAVIGVLFKRRKAK